MTLEEAVHQVILLHSPYSEEGQGWRTDPETGDWEYANLGRVCSTCGSPEEYGVAWPCPTFNLLTGSSS